MSDPTRPSIVLPRLNPNTAAVLVISLLLLMFGIEFQWNGGFLAQLMSLDICCYILMLTTWKKVIIWGKFQYAYKSRTGKTLSLTDEPEALSPDKFSEVLRSQEPSVFFIENIVNFHLFSALWTK